MGQFFSEDGIVTLAETADIGGTNTATAYVSMKGFSKATLYAEVGTWDSGDDVDTLKIQQATDSSGTSVKDLTTSASGGNYDSDSPLDADGDFAYIEINAEDLDTDNGFTHIRGYVAEAGNSGTDNITLVLLRYGAKYPAKELAGAATSGSKVYYKS
jgi:hypothetical protein